METQSHLLPQPGKTFLLATVFAVSGTFIAFLTEWMIIIPLLFSLAIPLVNIRMPGGKKMRNILLIMLGTVIIFAGAVLLMLNIDYSREFLQATVTGLAGCLILLLNGLLVPALKLSVRAFALTFILSALSAPLGMYLNQFIPPSDGSLMAEFIGQYGIMMFWMMLTTVGILYGTSRT